MDTKQLIIAATREIIAKESFAGFSVRKLARMTGLSPSHLYYYTKDTKQLFREILDVTAISLGKKRAELNQTKTAAEMLAQRIAFQFDNAEEVIFILKYYLAFREEFKRNPQGYVPNSAYKHIMEVLEAGQLKGEWKVANPIEQAKVITHAINGFVLEYYPEIPMGEEKEILVIQIQDFILKALGSDMR